MKPKLSALALALTGLVWGLQARAESQAGPEPKFEAAISSDPFVVEILPRTTTTAPPTTTTTPPPTTSTPPPPPPPSPPPAPEPYQGDVWADLAECESGMTNANTGNGYYGYFQFSLSTWHAVGGPGYPTDHDYATQKHYAQILQQRAGWGQWPACSRELGLR